MKGFLIALFFVFFAAAYAFLGDMTREEGTTEEDACAHLVFKREELRLRETVFTVMRADTPEKRVCGLSYKKKLSEHEGMLFVFDTPDQHSIWMKGMRFPLDITWIDASSAIVHIEEDVSPDSFPHAFRPSEPALYVLELNAGAVDLYGIQEGDMVNF